jgi:hypothetical protein
MVLTLLGVSNVAAAVGGTNHILMETSDVLLAEDASLLTLE